MGYERHVVRTRHWLDAAADPIGREEWNDYARRHPRMAEDGWADWEDIGREPFYTFVAADGERATFYWRNGDVRIAGSRVDAAELVAIADDLRAMVVGDEGELYTADGPLREED